MASKAAHPIAKRPIPDLVASLRPKETEGENEETVINAVIETPQGSRNKYKYDEEMGQFKLAKVLPAGFEFPFSFGFIPQTLAEDGDPVDILVFADSPVPMGCIVPSRLIGVMEAEKIDGGEHIRNDRLIAVASESNDHADLTSFKKINPNLMREIEYFFVSYHQLSGKRFKILACRGPSTARKLLDDGISLYRSKHPHRGNGKR
jgi:inorganic pyrophosphatase